MISPGLGRSRHSVVGTVTELRAGRTRNRGSIPHRCHVFISCPKRPDPVVDLTQPPGTGGFSWRYSDRGVSLTTHPIHC
jgi:hypothetical protein